MQLTFSVRSVVPHTSVISLLCVLLVKLNNNILKLIGNGVTDWIYFPYKIMSFSRSSFRDSRPHFAEAAKCLETKRSSSANPIKLLTHPFASLNSEIRWMVWQVIRLLLNNLDIPRNLAATIGEHTVRISSVAVLSKLTIKIFQSSALC